MTFAWYVSSMVAATSSKELLVGGESRIKLTPLELTCYQMVCATVYASILSVLWYQSTCQLRIQSFECLKNIILLALTCSMGFLTLNMAYESMSTSLANTLRALEPLNSLLLTAILGSSVSLTLGFSVLPIVIGSCLASYGNSQFTWIGLFYCSVANFAFAARIFMLVFFSHKTLGS